MGNQLPATVTPFSSTELLNALCEAFKNEVGSEPEQAAICVLAAQIALETNNGKACVQYNIGNFKAALGADYCTFKTIEWVKQPDGSTKPIEMMQNFAVFPSLAVGCAAFIRSMRKRWTLAWPSVLAGDPQGFAQGLHDQKPYPYYTAPVSQYVAGVNRWFGTYMALGWPPGTPVPDFSSVAVYQQELIDEGYDLGPSGADGDAGPLTKAAVMKFQEAHGLVADGVVGPKTQAALLAEYQKRVG